MVKEIRKIGNSKGIILDTAILDAMKIDVGDKVEITIHPGGNATIEPIASIPKEEFESALHDVLEDYNETFKKLS